MPAAAVEVVRLTHRYPGADRAALRDVSFEFCPGERVGLLGPNGAGKSTLMRILCGYLGVQDRQGHAAVRVAGFDVATQALAVRQRVGYLPEQVPIYPELRVREHLEFRARLKNVAWRRLSREVGRVMEMTGLSAMADTSIHRLSRGYRQRVGVADALLGSPPLVVLDEPTVGLDPNQVLSIRAMLRAIGGSQTLLFSSHILAEVEALCDRIVILSRGEIVTDQTLETATRTRRIHVEVEASAAELEAVLKALAVRVPGSFEVVQAAHPIGEDDRFAAAVIVGGDALARDLGRACAAAKLTVVRLEILRRQLEEHFARVTGAQGDASASLSSGILPPGSAAGASRAGTAREGNTGGER